MIHWAAADELASLTTAYDPLNYYRTCFLATAHVMTRWTATELASLTTAHVMTHWTVTEPASVMTH